MTTPAYQRERRRLAEALKALRIGAGLSGARLAEMLNWQQSKVSKIETRKQLPTEEDISAWVGAAGGSPETAGELISTLRGARVEFATWKDAFRDSGADGVQADILELEAQTTRIAEFQPSQISGLLQTADYAREYLHLPCGPLSFGADEETIDQMVAKRMQRQQVLYQHGKQVTVVMLEGALRARLVSAPTLAGQLDRLMAVSGLASLELCITRSRLQSQCSRSAGSGYTTTWSSWNRSSESSSWPSLMMWRAMRSTWNCCVRRRPEAAIRRR